MDPDLREFLLALGALVLCFVAIAVFMRLLGKKLYRWGELAADFALQGPVPDVVLYKYCGGHAGKMSPSDGRRGGFTLGFADQGLLVRHRDKKSYPDLLVPWDKVRPAEKSTLGDQSAIRLTVDHPVPLVFYLGGEAMRAFEVRRGGPAPQDFRHFWEKKLEEKEKTG